MQETNANPLLDKIKDRLARFEFHKELEPVKTTLPGGTKLFMERIKGTTKYLSHLRKMIYDVVFVNTYYHNGKIPVNHLVVDNILLKIEAMADIYCPEKFLEIMNNTVVCPRGCRFYLDDVLYMKDVPFLKADKIRDNLLQQRHDGTMIYDILKIIDPSGNTTEFHASPAVQNRMGRARGIAHLQMMIAHD
jgi:hypothetical protein